MQVRLRAQSHGSNPDMHAAHRRNTKCSIAACLTRMLSSLGEQLTFNGVHELVGCIHDLYETTAVAALGNLLSIPQHTTCNMHIQSYQDTNTDLVTGKCALMERYGFMQYTHSAVQADWQYGYIGKCRNQRQHQRGGGVLILLGIH